MVDAGDAVFRHTGDGKAYANCKISMAIGSDRFIRSDSELCALTKTLIISNPRPCL